MAYEIFDIPHATRVRDGSAVHWNAYPNNSRTRPTAGSVILWNEGGEFEWTGHVAIATEVTDTYLRIAEQNVEDVSWEGKDYARELVASVDADGRYNVRETWGKKGGCIKGWLNLPEGFLQEPIPYTIPSALP
jgi:glutathionylspermidine amidase/synthetase